MRSNKKGFTLLELVIIIGIIGILAGVFVFSSFTGTQKRANDVRRKTDVKNIQTAMEQYFSTCGNVYPTGPFTSIECGSQTILSAVPKDPKTGADYTLTSTDGSSYSVCTDSLEYETPSEFCLENQQ